MSERLEGHDWEMTLAILEGVRRDLASGSDPEGDEPDDHKAVRLIEDEAVRARREETVRAGRIVALESETDLLRAEIVTERQRADKAESLLKEALPQLRSWVMAGRPMEATADLLERARQEGFEP